MLKEGTRVKINGIFGQGTFFVIWMLAELQTSIGSIIYFSEMRYAVKAPQKAPCVF